MFYILLHIFAFWIIIILFVPFIIIIPIPIIPFILPIPLKYLLLIPFQKLTDRGILPLMRRVLFGFISEDTTKHLFNSYYNIYDFFYDNLKEMISDFFILVMKFSPFIKELGQKFLFDIFWMLEIVGCLWPGNRR